MPKGVYPHTHVRPKEYPADLVERVTTLYESGMTQREVADDLGVGLKTVRVLMRNHGIPRRVAAKRDQAGSSNTTWRGDDATYHALHSRVYRARGPASDHPCSRCGTRERRRVWANLTGRYADTADYAPMCDSCHHRYDRERRDDLGDMTVPQVLRR